MFCQLDLLSVDRLQHLVGQVLEDATLLGPELSETYSGPGGRYQEATAGGEPAVGHPVSSCEAAGR